MLCEKKTQLICFHAYIYLHKTPNSNYKLVNLPILLQSNTNWPSQYKWYARVFGYILPGITRYSNSFTANNRYGKINWWAIICSNTQLSSYPPTIIVCWNEIAFRLLFGREKKRWYNIGLWCVICYLTSKDLMSGWDTIGYYCHFIFLSLFSYQKTNFFVLFVGWNEQNSMCNSFHEYRLIITVISSFLLCDHKMNVLWITK